MSEKEHRIISTAEGLVRDLMPKQKTSETFEPKLAALQYVCSGCINFIHGFYPNSEGQDVMFVQCVNGRVITQVSRATPKGKSAACKEIL